MRVILLERIAKLGQMGDEVTVKPGFARNFLLPRGKALRANKANREYFESQRVQLEARNLELKTEAEGLAGKVDGTNYIAIRQAGDTGQLYGSVSTKDIMEIVTEAGFSINSNQVMLDKPIKLLGMHNIRLALHPEVQVGVVINVARTKEEAERQAAGEDVTKAEEDEYEGDNIGLAAQEMYDDDDDDRPRKASDRDEGGADDSGESASGEDAAEEERA